MDYEVRSTDPRGHCRSGRRWEYAKAVVVPATEVTGAMRGDPRLEIVEVVEPKKTVPQLKREQKRGGFR